MRCVKKIILLVFLLLILSSHLIAQRLLINADSAINIALRYGLKIGLSKYEAKLQSDTLWLINSLVCDDEYDKIYDTKIINAVNGGLIDNISFCTIQPVVCQRLERTIINSDFNSDSLPKINGGLTKMLAESVLNISNPIFSDNDKKIVFQYGYMKIGIVNIDGTGFKGICDECMNPMWLNDDWVIYIKGFDHIYKKNIKSNTEIRITNKSYRFMNFKISPNRKWFVYQSSEMWPSNDSLGNQILYSSINGEGQNLCLLSIDGKEKKFFHKEWMYYYNPCWTSQSDSIFFYILDQKYLAANLNDSIINYSKFYTLQNISLNDNEKVINGTFPIVLNCQILEINKKLLKPTRILVNEIGRYRDVYYSHNMEHIIYLKREREIDEYKLWIKSIKN
jgi:hypothetical protein